ncbi:hypothetical protein OJ997_18090 [Solirubrobacter phytolaccae]|uniref:DUF916 domain-containing protein n=1 Tax=Solirubrobacter phytolaccae TaxID=1404360 RepID=A0A9X3SGA4_9ACTN|nr:hypothetical protein [Solirubrobacter phytolaccae]MDA0182222.1 hypothetical protein [Solirubrobacter phytolaccae]
MTLRPISPRVVVVLLLTLGLVGSLTRPAAAADWTLAPADTTFGSGRQAFRYTLNPGGTLEDAVAVFNTGAAPLDVTLRAADGVPGLELAQAAVTVPAGETAEVPFTLTLPQDAEAGDRVGGIVAAGGGSEATAAINLRVGGPLTPSLVVEDVRMEYSGGDATVEYTLRNTGNAILSAQPTVSVSGPFGRWKAAAGKLPDSPAVLPGKTWKGSARVPDVTPAVRLSATVELLPLITDEAGSVSPLKPVQATGHAFAIPWLLVLALLVVVGVVVAVARRRPARARVSSVQHLG